ncbi:MAG: glycosyltransferase family 4 protein [Pseudomonadota bacterium]
MDLPIRRLLVFTRDTDFYSEQMLREMQRRGMEVAVVVEPQRQAAVRERAPELALLDGPALRHRFDSTAVRGYAAIIDSFRPDICLCFTSRAFGLAVLARRKSALKPPLIGTRGAMGGISAFNPLDWLTYLNPRVEAIVGFSRAIEQRLRGEATRLWPGHPGRFVTVHQAYDVLPSLIPQRPGRPAAGTVRLLCVANDRPIKGVDLLLDALDQHAARNDWHLDVAGRMGPAIQARVERSARLKARVTLHGFRHDVRQLYQQADLYIQPTRSPGEGIGNAIAEAMAAGLPCVVTRAGGAVELVAQDENGWAVTPDDPAALGEALDALMAQPELMDAMGQRAAARLAQHFSLAQEVSRYLALFAQLRKAG